MTDLEHRIATVREYRAELYWQYQRLLQESPQDARTLDINATERIRATKVLEQLNKAYIQAIEADLEP